MDRNGDNMPDKGEGCLSPDGTWYPIPYGQHNEFLIHKYVELYAPGYSLSGAFSSFATRDFPDKMVNERKWIICGCYMDGEIIITGPSGRWTEPQIAKIRKLYGDNKKVLHKLEYHMED